MRQTLRLPLAEGLERAAGAFIVKPSSFRDLRNVHIRDGRLVVREGLGQKALVVGGVTDILAVHPLRSASQSLLVCYDSATRAVTLRRVAIDPLTLNLTLTVVSGTMWTIPVTARFPVVSVTDSFGKAFLAHDEPSLALRQDTQVYNPLTDTYTDLLYNSTADTSVLFRGVARWLSYLVGWGFGTTNLGPPDDRNRPEILRVSLPGDPERFRPEFYFSLGQRGEPIMGGVPIRAGFVAAKEGELHLVTGTSQRDFDSKLIDPVYGVVSGASMVVVQDTVFFWSAEGPRYTQGDASVEIGSALDLRGEVPDELLALTDFRSCHGTYRPDREEIEWLFPVAGRNQTWSYVLDISGGVTRTSWSYRRYEQLVRSSGLLAGNIAFDPGDPSVAAYVSLTDLTANADSYYEHTAGWTNHNVANLPAGATVEIWASGGTGAFVVSTALPWYKVKDIAASGATQTDDTTLIGEANTAQPWRHLAVRYRLADGTYFAASASANPMDWPANTRQSLNGPARPEIGSTVVTWDGAANFTTPLRIDWANAASARLDALTEVEIWGMGSETLGGPGVAPDTWTLERTVSASGATQFETGVVVGQQRRHIALRYRRNGQFYTHSQDANPWLWPAGSRHSILLDGPRPVLTFAWDLIGGIDRSPGTLTITLPDASLAPTGTWVLELYRTVWFSGIGYALDAIPVGAWDLVVNATYSPQPPATVSESVSSISSAYRILYAARLRLNGNARPTSYQFANPALWPSVSRLTVNSL